MALYRLKTIRLVNFHNFVDHTIAVLGHLFLVGDNASGKTTVLDAVQWVLSGGQDLEFNAAARVSGSREEGRTLHGAVQRRDSERGVINTARAVTYAALELEDEEGGPALSIGMGAELAHPEAQIATWGFMREGPLSEVPLLVPAEVPGALRPAKKEELRDALGKDRVYFQVGRYRDVLADKLTAGEHYFSRLTDFWRISKAYKQIAAQTQDHSQLLRKMLPKPDEEAFLKVSRGMEALAQIEDSLGGLREQLDYLRGLREHQLSVDRAREEVARYTFLKTLKERDLLSETLARQDSGLAAIRTEQERLGELVGQARAAVASREAELQDLRRQDREGLLEKRIELERDSKEAEAAAAAQEKAVKAANMEIARAAKALVEARRVFTQALSQWAVRCSALGPPLQEESKQAFLRTLAAGTRGADPESAWAQADLISLHTEVLAAQGERLSSMRGLAQTHSQEEAALAAARTSLAELDRATEEQPDLPGYAACLRRLSETQLRFQPLYALLEKSPAADENDFRDLEALLGERVLGAIVPEPEDAAEITRVVLAEFPGIAVIRTDLPAGDLGDHWLGRLLSHEGCPAEAAAYLSKVCGTPEKPSAMLMERGIAEDRGARLKLARRPFPLLGLTERRSVRRKRSEEARESVSRLERLLSQSAAAMAKEEWESERQGRFLSELSAAREGTLNSLAEDCREKARAEDRLRERHRLAKDDAARRSERTRRLLERLEALRRRLAAEGLQNLDELLTQRVNALRSATDGLETGLRNEAGAIQKERSLQDERSRTESSLTQAQRHVDDRAAALAPLVEEKHRADLERYVLDVRQGRQFKDRIENIEERRRAAERAGDLAEAGVKQGISDMRYSGRFGFNYDPAGNLILDRRGEPLDGPDDSVCVEERGGSGDAQRHEAIDQQRPLHLAGDDQRKVLRLLDDDAARVRCKWVVGDDMVCALPASVNRRPRLSAADH